MADATATALWLAELVSDKWAEDKTDVVIHQDGPQFALVSLEESTVYLVTVAVAQLVPVSPDTAERS